MSQAKHIAGSVAGPPQVAVKSSDMLVYLDFTQYYRSLLMSFCWPKTTPIAAPIKSFALKTTWAIVFAVLCILKLNAETPLGSLNDMGHSTLADLLIYCRMCRGQIHYDPFASNWPKAWTSKTSLVPRKVESLLLNWQDGQDFFFHHTLWDQVIRATRLCWLLAASPSLLAKSERVKGSDFFWAFFKSLPSKLKLRTRCRASKMSDFRLAFGGYTTQKVWRALTATRGVSKIRYLS